MQSSHSTGLGPVRLPLQTGASAFSAIAFWPALMVLLASSAATGNAWFVAYAPDGALRIVLMVVQVLVLVFTISPLALLGWIGLLIYHARRALELRACDVLLGHEELRFDGGPADGQHLRLADIDPTASAIENGVLYLSLRDGERRAVACASDADEQTSLAVLLESIRAATHPRTDSRPHGAAASLLDCASCGATATPADRPTVPCTHCGQPIAVPAPMRENFRVLRETAASRRAADHAVERLLHQPGARRANLVIAACSVALLALWPVSGLLPLMVFADPARASAGWFSCLILGAALLLLSVERVVVADRQAMLGLITGFSARTPERAASPSRCRCCAAPLPTAPGVVVRCAFCRAANVLHIDVHAEAAVARSQAQELDSALSQRSRARRRRGLALLATTGLAILGWNGFRRASRAEAIEDAAKPTCAMLDASPDPPGALGATAAVADLARVTSDRADEWDPALSPDLRTLLVTVSSDAGEAVAALPAAGGELVRLQSGRQPCWISKADYWFVKERADLGEFEAEALYRSTYNSERSGSPGPAASAAADGPRTTGANVDSPAVSPDGIRVLFGHRFARSGYFGLQGFGPQGPISFFTGSTSPRSPAFAPSGTVLAFTAQAPTHRHIFVTPWNKPAGARAITCGAAAGLFPAFSPRGDRIAFLRVDGAEDEQYSPGDLFTVRVDGRDLVQLTRGRAVVPRHITWGRDGYIYFSSRNAGGADIWRLRPQD